MLYTKNNDVYTEDDIYAKPGISLTSHLLDVGYIAAEICKKGSGKDVIARFSQLMEIPEENIVNSIAFLCATHDIGKTHPIFQNGLANTYDTLSERLKSLGMRRENCEKIRHERYSVQLLEEYLIKLGFDKDIARDLTSVVAYHHQGKDWDVMPNYPKVDSTISAIQISILDEIYNTFPISKDIQEVGNRYFCGFSNFVASAMIISDWIASGEKWKEMSDPHKTIVEKAYAFLEKNHMLYKPIKDRLFSEEHYTKWSDVFPDFLPNDMQKKAIEVAKSNNGFDLMIIEAPCGCGKTEAGLAAAVVAGKNKSGIYFAMPTMSTAKRMIPRVRKLAKLAKIDEKIPELDSSAIWSDDEMDNIDKDLWTSASRHHMLYPFAVGTVDQVIKTILKYRYSHVGLLGLADKAVIIDEVHAYDAFMQTELQTLIKYCKMMHCPVVLLSATLNTKNKRELLKAAGCTDFEPSMGYPMITIAKDRKVEEYDFTLSSQKRSYNVFKCESIVDKMYEIACSSGDGCTAFITDTVDNAIQLYKCLKNNNSLNAELILYHSRNTVEHNSIISNKLETMFGKDRTNRPKKAFLIATSIVEQSLDIDMDYLVTALAPLDLLIQRFGRQGRHDDKGTVREKIKCAKYITIIVPKEYGALKYIYSGEKVLENTESVIIKRSSIDIISDVRPLIDEVYDFRDLKKLSSQMSAGYKTLSEPSKDTPDDTNLSKESYEQFNITNSATRESTYPTVQIAILPCFDESAITFDDIKNIRREHVVSIGQYLLKNFNTYKEFEDIRIYVGDNDTMISDDGRKIMRLDSEMGLVFEENCGNKS